MEKNSFFIIWLIGMMAMINGNFFHIRILQGFAIGIFVSLIMIQMIEMYQIGQDIKRLQRELDKDIQRLRKKRQSNGQKDK